MGLWCWCLSALATQDDLGLWDLNIWAASLEQQASSGGRSPGQSPLDGEEGCCRLCVVTQWPA